MARSIKGFDTLEAFSSSLVGTDTGRIVEGGYLLAGSQITLAQSILCEDMGEPPDPLLSIPAPLLARICKTRLAALPRYIRIVCAPQGHRS